MGRDKRNFALVELIMVLAILSIVIAMLTPNMLSVAANAKNKEYEAKTRSIVAAFGDIAREHYVDDTLSSLFASADINSYLAGYTTSDVVLSNAEILGISESDVQGISADISLSGAIMSDVSTFINKTEILELAGIPESEVQSISANIDNQANVRCVKVVFESGESVVYDGESFKVQ